MRLTFHSGVATIPANGTEDHSRKGRRSYTIHKKAEGFARCAVLVGNIRIQQGNVGSQGVACKAG